MSKNHISENHHPELVSSLKVISHSAIMFQNAVASKMNMNPVDVICIDFLIENGPATAGELSRLTGLTTGAITSVIDRLENAGYVKRERDPGDRRKVMVVFVPEKHKKITSFYDSLKEEFDRLASGYTKKELKLLIPFVKDVNTIYKKNTPSL